jgi:hypothetical protein
MESVNSESDTPEITLENNKQPTHAARAGMNIDVYEVVTHLGETVVPAKYSVRTSFKNGLIYGDFGIFEIELYNMAYQNIGRFKWVNVVNDEIYARGYEDETIRIYDFEGNFLRERTNEHVPFGSFVDDVAIYKEGDLFGLMNREGQVVLDATYDDLELVNNGFYMNNKYNDPQIININGDIIEDAITEREGTIAANRILYRTEDYTTGVKDQDNKVVIEAVHREISSGFNGYYVVDNHGGNAFVIDEKGNRYLENQYVDIRAKEDGHFSVLERNDASYINVDKHNQPLAVKPYKTYADGTSVKLVKGKRIVLDATGKIVLSMPRRLDFIYDELNQVYAEPFVSSIGTIKYCLKKLNGDYTSERTFADVTETQDGLFIVSEYGQNALGVIDETGQYLMKPQFQNLTPYSSGVFGGKSSTTAFGYFTLEGQYIIEPVYSGGSAFRAGYAVVELPGYIGSTIINMNNEMVIDRFYYSIDYINDETYKVYDSYYVLKQGQFIKIPEEAYEAKTEINSFYDEANDHNYLVNEKGDRISEINYDYMFDSENNEFLVINENDGLDIFLIDQNEKVLERFEHFVSSGFSDGLALYRDVVDEQTLEGFVNRNDEVVIEAQFENVAEFRDGYSAYFIEDQIAYINDKGERLSDLLFDTATYLTPYEAVSIEEKTFINTDANLSYETPDQVTVESSDHATLVVDYDGNVDKSLSRMLKDDLVEGRYIIEIESYNGVMDKDGKMLVLPYYSHIGQYSEGFADYRLNGKAGYMDYFGQHVFDRTFDQVTPFKNGYARVTINDRDYTLDREGQLSVYDVSKDTFEKQFLNRLSRNDKNQLVYLLRDGTSLTNVTYYTDEKHLYLVHLGDETTLYRVNTTFDLIEGEVIDLPSDKLRVIAITDTHVISYASIYDKEEKTSYSFKCDDDMPFSKMIKGRTVDSSYSKDNQLAYFNTETQQVMPVDYWIIESFSDGLAAVRNHDGLCGYIDETGSEVISVQYSYASSFINGKAIVATADDILIINKQNEVLKIVEK